MTDQVLDILKLVLLALLYLFFARVLWAVWSEVRQPVNARQGGDHPAVSARPQPTPAAGAAAPADRRAVKAPKGRKGSPARLVIIEPKDRKGTTFAIDTGLTLGREADNRVVIENDSYISSHHARVVTEGSTIFVDDLGSRNGTYLNGARLTKRQVVHIGDRIQVGYTVLEAQ